MEKMSKEEAFVTATIDELYEIKSHLCNGRMLEGGIGLGGLIKQLMQILGEIKKCGEEEEHLCCDCREDDEDEEEQEGNHICDKCGEPCEEPFDWEAAHDKVEEENRKIRKDLKDANSEINLVKSIVKDLIKDDHIFPGKLDHVIKKLALCRDENVDALYALQSGRTIRIPS